MDAVREFKGRFAFLANDYPCVVRWHDGIEFKSAEACLQALKTQDKETRRRLARLVDAADARREGRKIKPDEEWYRNRYEYLRSVLSIKFGEETLMAKLDDTGDALLLNGNRYGDQEWGIADGKGDNLLGKCLMQVRDENRRFILHGKKK